MRLRILGDYLVDVFLIGLAAVITISVVGLALDSGPAQQLYAIPVVGPFLSGVRAFWQHAYDPKTV